MKRLFDFIAALAGIIILSPLINLISLTVIISMGWPVFYSQRRIGKDGIPFRIIKFRTMIRNADQKGLLITAENDPRVTKLGNMLRNYKLDELPQLWNVLAGNMSLVGPRPEVPRYVEMYDERQRTVLSVRPGLTDPATIAYRNEEEILAGYKDFETGYIDKIMPDKLDINLAYLEKSSFGADLGVLFKTAIRVFDRR